MCGHGDVYLCLKCMHLFQHWSKCIGWFKDYYHCSDKLNYVSVLYSVNILIANPLKKSINLCSFGSLIYWIANYSILLWGIFLLCDRKEHHWSHGESVFHFSCWKLGSLSVESVIICDICTLCLFLLFSQVSPAHFAPIIFLIFSSLHYWHYFQRVYFFI